jgi:DNA-binding MarR family transcriptional regulator
MTHQDSVEWSRTRWIEAGQPDPDHFAAMTAVLRLTQGVGASLDRMLREQDLGRTAYLVLATLCIARDGTLTMSQLSKRLIMHPTTISLVVDQLQTKGLVDRGPHPSDRRTVLATITPAGHATLTKASTALAAGGYGLDGVSDRLAITLTEVVRQVREAIGDE